MGKNTKIEWAHHTFNPWIGCTKISPACDHCYAAEWDKRYGGGEHWGAGAPRRRTSVDNWRQPYRWAKRAWQSGQRPRVFCASLADVFDNEIDPAWRKDLWKVIRETPELDWLLLTKRISNVRDMLPPDWDEGWPHVWLGITVVTQDEADRDIPKLLAIDASVRWLSMEPLLESVDVSPYLPCPMCLGWALPLECDSCAGMGPTEDDAIDWIVAGGESGPRARFMHPDWVRSLRDCCDAFGVPFLFKQWGEHVYLSERAITLDTPDWQDAHNQLSWAPHWGTRDGKDVVYRIGKKAAGRLLDGREHNGFPESATELAEAERSYTAEDSL